VVVATSSGRVGLGLTRVDRLTSNNRVEAMEFKLTSVGST
jgi:hypothetical protein